MFHDKEKTEVVEAKSNANRSQKVATGAVTGVIGNKDAGNSKSKSKTQNSKVNKRRSKLKFDKSTKDSVANVRSSKETLRSTGKKNSVKNLKACQKKNIKKTYSASKRVSYDGIKDRFRDLLKKVKEWVTGGLRKIEICKYKPTLL